MSIDILNPDETNVVSHINFKRFRKSLREAVPDFVAENRRIKGSVLSAAVQPIDQKITSKLNTVLDQLEHIIEQLAGNNKYKIVCLRRTVGLTLKVHKVFDFRVDVESLSELKTAYYLMHDESLLALYTRMTKIDSISWQEALAPQARYNDFNNALRKKITALIALISEIETVVQITGIKMQKKEHEYKVNCDGQPTTSGPSLAATALPEAQAGSMRCITSFK